MSLLWLLAVAMIGPQLLQFIVVGRARMVGRRAPSVVDPTVRAAILITVRDREDAVAGAVCAAAGVVGAGRVFVVSDASRDRTAEVARSAGAEVVETFAAGGREAAITAGLAAFRLADRFDAVVVTEVDERLEADFGRYVLPWFTDPSVSVVEGSVEAGVASVGPLAAFDLRDRVLVGRRGVRCYRPEVLARIDDPVPGRVVSCVDVVARVPGSGGWWARRVRDRLAGGRLAAGVSLVASVILLVCPVALVAVEVAVPWVIAAIVVPDYLLTIAVVVMTGRTRLLLPGLLFPLLRLADAAATVTALIRRPANRSEVAPVSDRDTSWGLAGWLAAVVAAAVVVARVVWSAARVPPGGSESAVVASVYAAVTGGSPDVMGPGGTVVAEAQLRAYVTVSRALGRHTDLVTALRELSVVAVSVALVSALAVMALLRVRPVLVVTTLGLLALHGAAVGALVPVGPGVVALGWLSVAAVAGVATVGRRDVRWIALGVVAAVVALATAPLLVVPVVAGAGVGLAARRQLLGFGVAAAVLVGIVVARMILAVDASIDARQGVLAGAAVLIAGAALTVRWLRPAAAAVGTGGLACLVLGMDAAVLQPAVVVSAAVLVAVLVEETLSAAGQRSRPSTVNTAVGAVAAVAMLAGTAVGFVQGVPAGARPAHTVLANWIASQIPPGTRIAVAADVWADVDRDLVRAGWPPDRIRILDSNARPGVGELGVLRDSSNGDVVIAAFPAGGDDAGPRLSVIISTPSIPYLATESRELAGAELAGNDRLVAPEQVLAALRAGRVDLRVMAVLASLCQDHRVTVAASGNLPAESDGPQPHRSLTVSFMDGQRVGADPGAAGTTEALLSWLRVQQPPFAPDDIRVGADGVDIAWRFPSAVDTATY